MAQETLTQHTDSKHDSDHKDDLWDGGNEPFKASYGKLMMWYFLLSDAFTFAGLLIAYGTLRFSSPTWPVPDFVFQALPGVAADGYPLIFVTIMTFILIVSSVTMVRAVQEGHRYNKRGVVVWMFATIIGGAMFLGCQAIEWYTLIVKEHMTLNYNPFGTHTESGTYLEGDNHHIKAGDTFEAGDSYLIHMHDGEYHNLKYTTADGETKSQAFGPKAFGQLFFAITGFHGFHVLSGVVFLLIVMVNVMSGLYHDRGNHYEMVEKIGLYWHFVDLVWVFVFLVFYLL